MASDEDAGENPAHPPVEGPESGLADARQPDSADEVARLAAEVERLERALAEAREEAAGNLERARRALADFDNYRKRARAEQQSARERAKEEVLGDLLAVVDNFDRALEHADDEEGLYEGVKLIYRQLAGILEKQGLTRINTEGHPFDPTVHEAVMREPTGAYADGTIIKELERGYFLSGRVLRPAKVKVAVAPAEGERPPPEP